MRVHAILLLLLSGCASATLKPLSQADADRGSKMYPGLTLASLQEGETLFKTTCTRCHALKDPGKKTVNQWNRTLPRMTRRAKIDEETKTKITRYLHTMSRQAE